MATSGGLHALRGAVDGRLKPLRAARACTSLSPLSRNTRHMALTMDARVTLLPVPGGPCMCVTRDVYVGAHWSGVAGDCVMRAVCCLLFAVCCVMRDVRCVMCDV